MNRIKDNPIIKMSRYDSTETDDDDDQFYWRANGNQPSADRAGEQHIVWTITSSVKYDWSGFTEKVLKFKEMLHVDYKPLKFGTINWKAKGRLTIVVSIRKDQVITQYNSSYFLNIPIDLVHIINSYLDYDLNE